MKMIELSDSVKFPAEEYAGQGNAMLGIRGSGKTYGSTFMAEQLLGASIPFVAFDPIGVWRYLKTPGRGPGFPVVVAGEDGDLKLTPETAPEIVRAAMHDNIPLVLDTYSMDISKADERRIVQSCVNLLLHENKKHGLRHLFFEEAAEFCPQQLRPEHFNVYSAIEKLARMGRNAGLGYTLINQRSEQVNKAILELCDCLFLFRQKGKNSLTALEKWISFGDKSASRSIIQAIPSLAAGECFVWLPGTETPLDVKMPAKRSFHPDPRKPDLTQKAIGHKADVTLFVGQLQALLPKLAEEAKANDPVELKKEIDRLKKEMAKGGQAAAPAVDVEAIRQKAFDKGWEERGMDARATLRQLKDELEKAESGIEMMSFILKGELDKTVAPAKTNPVRPTWGTGFEESSKTARPAANANSSLSKAERAVLTALAQYPGGRGKNQIAVLTGYAVTGGGFNNAIGRCRSSGWLSGSDSIKITDAGLKELGSYTPLPFGRDLQDHWLRQLSKAEAAILTALIVVYPGSATKEEVARETGYEASGGGFNNALSRLRTLELIEGRGELKASENLF